MPFGIFIDSRIYERRYLCMMKEQQIIFAAHFPEYSSNHYRGKIHQLRACLDPRQISRIREAACQIASSDIFPKPIRLGNTYQTLYLAGGFETPASLLGIQTGPNKKTKYCTISFNSA